MPILSSRAFLENVKDPIYDLLSLIEPGIFLDIGASDGHMSALMLEKSPQSHVIAVEPFPANVQHMRDRLGSDSRVTIVPQAIYPYATEVRFAVASTVTDASGERRPGYSSLGRVVEKDDAAAEINIVVPATTVDKLLNDKCARFMKVDVQGGEIGVIRSAKAALEEQRIDIIFLEFAGQASIMSTLQSFGYFMFDSEYLLVPKDDADLSDWDLVNHRPFKLSSGRGAHHAWPKMFPTTDGGYSAFLADQRDKIGWVQTDLICISRKALPDILPNLLTIQKRP